MASLFGEMMLAFRRRWLGMSLAHKLIAAALATFALLVCCGLAPSTRASLVQWVQTGALLATAWLLVWYAWETRRMAGAVEEELASAARAELDMAVVDYSEQHLDLAIRNVGQAPASDMELWSDHLVTDHQAAEYVGGERPAETASRRMFNQPHPMSAARPEQGEPAVGRRRADFLSRDETGYARMRAPRTQNDGYGALLVLTWHDGPTAAPRARCWQATVVPVHHYADLLKEPELRLEARLARRGRGKDVTCEVCSDRDICRLDTSPNSPSAIAARGDSHA